MILFLHCKHFFKDKVDYFQLDLSLESTVFQILTLTVLKPNLTSYMKKVFKLNALFYMLYMVIGHGR